MQCVACRKECDELVKDGTFDICQDCADDHYDAAFEDQAAWQDMVDSVSERI